MIHISQEQLKTDKIKTVYQNVVAGKVRTAITKFFAEEPNYRIDKNPVVQDASRIVVAFLSKYNLDQMADESMHMNRIVEYLVGGADQPQRYLECIILNFWKCAAVVAIDRINTETGTSIAYLDDHEVKALSKWDAIKNRVLEQKDLSERRKLILSAINQKTWYLFDNVTATTVSEWKANAKVISEEEVKSIELKTNLVKAVYGEKNDGDEKRKDKKNVDSDSGEKSRIKKKTKGALDLLEEIFDYKAMNESRVEGTPRHQILREIKVPVCPYCNRQYITIYPTKSKSKRKDHPDIEETTADLDHFYIKSQYPYLALSLYNFIPSCQICNSRFKGTTDFYLYPHVYPYKTGFGDDAKFSTKLDAILSGDKDSSDGVIELQVRSGEEAIKNSISTFMLERVYQSHTDYVQEIKRKSEAYNEEMIGDLKKQYGDLLGDKRSIMDFLYGQYLDQSQFYLRPLSKLTRDILEECYGDTIDWKNI